MMAAERPEMMPGGVENPHFLRTGLRDDDPSVGEKKAIRQKAKLVRSLSFLTDSKQRLGIDPTPVFSPRGREALYDLNPRLVHNRVRSRIIEYVCHCDTGDRLQLRPIAKEIVAIGGCGQPNLLGRPYFVAELDLLVIAHDPIARRSGVAPVRTAVEVRLGQADIGLVRILLGLAQL